MLYVPRGKATWSRLRAGRDSHSLKNMEPVLLGWESFFIGLNCGEMADALFWR